MPNFYIESFIDDFTIWGVRVEADELDDAIFEAYVTVPDSHRANRISINNVDTSEKVHILTLQCPWCGTTVMEEDEEWMLTGTPGVYQHVDCYHPERMPAK